MVGKRAGASTPSAGVRLASARLGSRCSARLDAEQGDRAATAGKTHLRSHGPAGPLAPSSPSLHDAIVEDRKSRPPVAESPTRPPE